MPIPEYTSFQLTQHLIFAYPITHFDGCQLSCKILHTWIEGPCYWSQSRRIMEYTQMVLSQPSLQEFTAQPIVCIHKN